VRCNDKRFIDPSPNTIKVAEIVAGEFMHADFLSSVRGTLESTEAGFSSKGCGEKRALKNPGTAKIRTTVALTWLLVGFSRAFRELSQYKRIR